MERVGGMVGTLDEGLGFAFLEVLFGGDLCGGVGEVSLSVPLGVGSAESCFVLFCLRFSLRLCGNVVCCVLSELLLSSCWEMARWETTEERSPSVCSRFSFAFCLRSCLQFFLVSKPVNVSLLSSLSLSSGVEV